MQASRILIVGGSPDRFETTAASLRQAGCQVIPAFDGREALGLARKEVLDLIIVDVSRSVADGIDLCRRVRTDRELGETPLLLLGAEGVGEEIIGQGMRAGADGYLEGPCADSVLAARVARLVGQTRAESSSDRLAAIIESSEDAIVGKTLEGIITTWNTGAERIYGYTASKAVGRHASLIIPPDRIDEWRRIMEKIRGGQRVSHFETSRLRSDGQRVDVSETVSPVRDGAGKVIGASAIGRDISARNRLEREAQEVTSSRADRELRIALTYAESIIDTVREPLVVLTADLHVKTANRAFYHMFRVGPEDTEGRYLYELGAGQWGIPALVTLLEEVLPRESVFDDFEVEADFPTVGRRTMLLNARRLLDSKGGKSAMILLAIEDVTERMEAARRLKSLNVKLERSNRELEDFASVASHDLQEPLRKIQAFGDRLKAKEAESLSEQGRDYLERMQSAAGRMQRLINDLLSFSRVATKGRPFAPVDLGAVAREVLSDMEVAVERSSASIEVAGLPVIEADALQMRQLLQNLIGNALKYRRPDVRPLVRVRGEVLHGGRQGDPEAYPEAGAVCRLAVEDNGIGFDEKYLDRIFNVFQRLHGRKEYEGTGIGLAVCRKIVERHGGEITARSRPGEGSAFVVTLPVTQSKEA